LAGITTEERILWLERGVTKYCSGHRSRSAAALPRRSRCYNIIFVLY